MLTVHCCWSSQQQQQLMMMMNCKNLHFFQSIELIAIDSSLSSFVRSINQQHRQSFVHGFFFDYCEDLRFDLFWIDKFIYMMNLKMKIMEIYSDESIGLFFFWNLFVTRNILIIIIIIQSIWLIIDWFDRKNF